VRPHLLTVRLVHAFKIVHMFEKDSDMYDVIEIRPDRFKHYLERLKNLPRLGVHIWPGKFARGRINPSRPTNADQLANFRNMIVGANWCGRIWRRGRFYSGCHRVHLSRLDAAF
jgi:hypothetical protein